MIFRTCVLAGSGLFVLSSLLVSCSAADAAAQAGWKSHQDPSGFQVNLPEGWTSEGGNDGHALIHNADRTVLVLVQPFKPNVPMDSSPEMTMTSFIDEDLRRYCSKEFPNEQLSGLSKLSSNPIEWLAHIAYNSKGTPGQATLLYATDVQLQTGMIYAIAAPAKIFADKKGALIQVLKSFKYGNPTAPGSTYSAPPSGGLTFKSWTDPVEGRFTTQVPVGWKVYGGAYRFAPIDIRTQDGVVSPDGQIQIQYGEAKLTTFVPPGPSSQMRGLREGQQYQVNGVTYTVLHYLKGTEFSEQYADSKLKKLHPGLTVTGTKERPDLEEKIDAKLGGQGHISIGETDFTYTANGQTMQGASMAATLPIGQGLGSVWLAIPSFITAPADKMDEAWKVWTHLIDDSVDSPEWTQKQSQITAQFNQLIMANHEAAMQQLHDEYEKASARLSENFRGWDNVINGTVDVRDSSGAAFNVEAGHNYYWRRGNTVVGTNTATPPDINFTAMEQF